VGLRLKSQLVALCLSLILITLGALTYFHLTLSSQDNLIRTDLAGRRIAAVAVQQIQLFARSRAPGIGLRTALISSNPETLMESLRQTPGLIQFDVMAPDGTRLLSSGVAHDDGLQFQQALFWILKHKEVYVEIWGHHQGRVEPLVTVPPFYNGQVVHHSYHPLYDNGGNLEAVAHLAVVLPRAPLRISLIIIGYLTVATIFLISSVLSIYLWAEFALNRPLRGLAESLQELRSLDPSGTRPDDLPQPNELSEAARALNHVTLDLVKYQQELHQKTQRLEQANTQYRQLNEELEQKVAEKTLQMREFFSLVTHDLRIPLAAVSGYTELMEHPRSGGLADKQQRYVQHIKVANTHAQELVRNLLEAMKYEFGHPALQCEDFDLRQLLAEVQSQLAIEAKPLEIVTNPDQELSVWADRARLGRVLINLMSNALHHAGHVQVEVQGRADRVHVKVSDRGPGIPADELPHLFEKFKRPRSGAPSAPSSGLGLGLYIVHRILLDHGQPIRVTSEPGQGTAFEFELPRPAQEEQR
jgi:signal transduction histidine kinase